MTFNEANVNREADGKFGHKTGTPANISLNAGTAPTLAAWRADMERLKPILEPHVVEIDGQDYLSDSAPEEAARLHAQLTQIGYANGFFSVPSASQPQDEDSEYIAHILDETLPHGGNRYDGLQSIANRLSPRKAYEPVMVRGDVSAGARSGFGLQEVTQHHIDNPDVPWTVQLDENGLPSMMTENGKRLRYDSSQYRAADQAALDEYGLTETEDERNSRHLGDEINFAIRDGIAKEYPFLPNIDDGGTSVAADAAVGQTPDGREIRLFFQHSHGENRDGILYNVSIGGEYPEDATDYLYGSTGNNGEDLSSLASALRSIDHSGNFKRRPTAQELDEYEATDKNVTFEEWYSEKGLADGTINYVPYKADDIARVYETLRDPKWRNLD